jgi:NNP family nitrate/nitrite transporter-like MFS transporter
MSGNDDAAIADGVSTGRSTPPPSRSTPPPPVTEGATATATATTGAAAAAESDARMPQAAEHSDAYHPAESDDPFPLEDGSLMHLYESRLRRLREYETRVFSRYNNGPNGATPGTGTGISEEEEFQQRDLEQQQQQQQEQQRPPKNRFLGFYEQPRTTPFVSRHGGGHGRSGQLPPGVINVNDAEGEVMDDLTLSTGFNSNSNAGADVASIQTAPEGPEENDESKVEPGEEALGDQDERQRIPTHTHAMSVQGTEHSTQSSDDEGDHSKNQEDDRKYEQDSEGNQGDPYSYLAASDSKYEIYSVLVDPEQDDRAVEIALYSAARPHMRGFHFAWLAFFIAFFAWFAITPLLSEVARSLDLTRKEIWTSNTLAVAGSAVTRILAGPVNDIYGARYTMFVTLLFSAVPTCIAGAVIHGTTSLYITRLLIGVCGSAFVTCQFWTSSMFVPEVAGTANSLAAGWGNLGGGVAQVVMGSLLFPLLKVIYGGEGFGQAASVYTDDGQTENDYDRAADLAWRTAMVFPGLMCLYGAYFCVRFADDCPKGNFRKRKSQGRMVSESPIDAIRRGVNNSNTWLLVVQYGCCFGVEITMTNAAALYFQEEFGQNTETAAAIASVFGWMNLFARGIGGFCSDMASATYGMRGRLWIQVVTLIAEGGLVCLFSTADTLATAIVIMVMFSIFVQAAEGSTFGIVPYVDYSVTGSIAGIVGGGGNVGGVVFSLFFREFDNRTAFLLMGCIVFSSSILTAFIAISGHRALLCGHDASEVLDRRDAHAGQLGSLPNVDLHTHDSESHRNRQTTLRNHEAAATATATFAESPLQQSANKDGITSTVEGEV